MQRSEVTKPVVKPEAGEVMPIASPEVSRSGTTLGSQRLEAMVKTEVEEINRQRAEELAAKARLATQD